MEKIGWQRRSQSVWREMVDRQEQSGRRNETTDRPAGSAL
jgi:hypothetical protein